MGERHHLEKINIFDETAHVVEGYGEFSGMSREECREAIVAWFEEHGLLDHVEEHNHSASSLLLLVRSRPWLSEQWFVAVEKLKGPATEAVTSGKMNSRSRALDAELSHLDGKPQRLVHLASAVVGPSYPGF